MTFQQQMQRHAALLRGITSPSQDYFDAKPTFKLSYAPQSGEIFGILTQMLETFEANLSQSQKEVMKTRKHMKT